MYNFIIKQNPDAEVSYDYIKKFEDTYGIKLPQALGEYYLKFNGSEIRECRFEKDDMEFCVIQMISLNYGTMPVEKIKNYNQKNKATPETFFPLALDEDYDYYYWDSNTGKVYYLSLSNADNPLEISSNIEEFFDILQNSEEEEN